MQLVMQAPLVLKPSTSRGRQLTLFVVRLLRSTLFSFFVFRAYHFPLPAVQWFERLMLAVVGALDFPIAVVGLFLPASVRPASLWFVSQHEYHPVRSHSLASYLLVGIPTYLVIFYGVAAARRAISRRQAGQGAGIA